jgi:hypothetical protein
MSSFGVEESILSCLGDHRSIEIFYFLVYAKSLINVIDDDQLCDLSISRSVGLHPLVLVSTHKSNLVCEALGTILNHEIPAASGKSD